jgi:LysR family glycine cleavage system transcriptional activator
MVSLPPFAALRAFEAAARHLSFKDAAAELGLTPTAISHQVKLLEGLSKQRLFIRRTRRVELTEAGQAFAGALTPAFDAIARAYGKLSEDRARQTVTLGAGPLFASRWLAPRLGDLWTKHPEIDLRLHHSPLPVDQQLGQFDLAIAWGRGNWSGVTVEPLLRVEVTPVLSPHGRAEGCRLGAPKDLLALPLLHHRNLEGWRQWLAAAGVVLDEPPPGIRFEDANVLLQAALAGQGAALGIVPFIEDELSAGRLIRPFDLAIDPGEAYYLITPEGALDRAAVGLVRDWLLAV